MKCSAKKTIWQNEEVVELESEKYFLRIIPSIGANIIEYKYKKNDIDILNNVEDIEKYRKYIYIFGMPMLFPPNRIENGKFTFEGRNYSVPIRYEKSKHSLHGYFEREEFEIENIIEDKNKVVLDLVFNGDKDKDYFKYYPHELTLRVRYELSDEGLKYKFKCENRSKNNMPFGLGYHTTFKLPYTKEENEKYINIKLSIDKKIIIENKLANGKLERLEDIELRFREDGQNPLALDLDNHYIAKDIIYDNKKFNGAIIENKKENYKIIYEVGPSFKYWVLWNCNSNGRFISIEPQTWMINAPNLDIENSGLIIIKSKEEFVETCMLKLEK